MTKDIVITQPQDPQVHRLNRDLKQGPAQGPAQGPEIDKLSQLKILHFINIKALITLAGKVFEGWSTPFLSLGLFSSETIPNLKRMLPI